MKPADCIELGHGRWIPKHAISFEAIRASGPGGQHVNKVATAVRMRVVLEHVKGLNPESRQRLVVLLGRREKDGIAMLRSGASRSPQTNRRTAIKRFADLVHAAASPHPNGSQPNPLDLRYEKDCRTKNTTARRKDSAENVISKCDPWRYPTGSSGQLNSSSTLSNHTNLANRLASRFQFCRHPFGERRTDDEAVTNPHVEDLPHFIF